PDHAFTICQCILISPGVPRALPALARAKAAGIPIINDVEWLFRHAMTHTPGVPFIGITGSNGKYTVTTLIGAMLRGHGMRVGVGGNLGTPALELWDTTQGAYVLELSSFQLESIDRFHPRLAVLLNLTPDHLDRYPDVAAYLAAKRRVFANMGPGDRAVVNADDPLLRDDPGMLAAAGVTVIPFSIETPVPGGVYAADGWLTDHRHAVANPLIRLDEIAIRGLHNQANAAAATAIALAAGATPAAVTATLRQFPGLPHRMEWIRTVDGVAYYNDSKGTNVGATLMSLQSFGAGGIILIAGGRDKKGDFASLAPVAGRYVREAILMGEAANDLAAALTGGPRIHRVDNMTSAVRLAHQLARPPQTVLLSPACASFDMFKNFEDRGDRFREAVHDL
ncbi:MAG: UDP-N-acetylmuramoyl-L-alanine--D-glutamate ligase, partial [Nitrospinae bacterium]|nr:UDP-N-acetylmuramoyl-L-alanine--D-glutamate ligase [Nitrospinota bacterium]